jgi:hypothetical protein
MTPDLPDPSLLSSHVGAEVEVRGCRGRDVHRGIVVAVDPISKR